MSFLTTKNVFFFVPNIIGYMRIILIIFAFYFMPTNYIACGISYIVSVILDAFDGYAARALNQSSRFGAMLDQLTDRCGTMGLLVCLSIFYVDYIFWFQMSMVIDIACHWLYLHSTILSGQSSHKTIDLSTNPVMKIYYESKTVLGFMCMANELFYCALYVNHFTQTPIILGIPVIKAIAGITAPFAILKTCISLVHGYVACINIVSQDTKERQQKK